MFFPTFSGESRKTLPYQDKQAESWASSYKKLNAEKIYNPDDYMLLCASCNRAKSWSCEHCVNWMEVKQTQVCHACYWANVENYIHIALRQVRRLAIVWEDDEVQTYEHLKEMASEIIKKIDL